MQLSWILLLLAFLESPPFSQSQTLETLIPFWTLLSFKLVSIFQAILVVLVAMASALVLKHACALMCVMIQMHAQLILALPIKQEMDAFTLQESAMMEMPAQLMLATLPLDVTLIPTTQSTVTTTINSQLMDAIHLLDAHTPPEIATTTIPAQAILATPTQDVPTLQLLAIVASSQ